ncbi:hypothetical protein XACLE20_1790003 [Xanthomonas citri pv. citri]|nr:hypothetical protein XACLE20_1790003 [Xanthomonas citri pv. citri]CEH60872.1 hypothetical protein XACLE3_9030003 [Xanthomonas citri pv. citri]
MTGAWSRAGEAGNKRGRGSGGLRVAFFMPAVWRCWEKRGGRPFGWWLGFWDVGELSGGCGGSPGPCPNLPGGGFSGAAPGRVLRLKAKAEKRGGKRAGRAAASAGPGAWLKT